MNLSAILLPQMADNISMRIIDDPENSDPSPIPPRIIVLTVPPKGDQTRRSRARAHLRPEEERGKTAYRNRQTAPSFLGRPSPRTTRVAERLKFVYSVS